MRQIGTVFAPRNWSLLLRDPKSGELVFTLVTGGAEAKTLRGKRIPPGKGIAGWIVANRRPAIIEDVSTDARFDPTMDQLSNFKTRSIIGVPLVSRTKVFGVIELVNKINGESFTALDLKVLSTIADFAAIAIEKAYYLGALRRIAMVDDLTQLANRRALGRALEHEVARCRRGGSSVAMLMIDVDDFKSINDTHGHAMGDAVLKHVAAVLRAHVREVDIVARYGGDEFAVVMPDTDAVQAAEVKGRIERALREATDRPVPYGASIGVHAGTPSSVDELFHGADLRLYREKDRKQEVDIDDVCRHITDYFEDDAEHNGDES